ncbi:DUF7370 family protein [Pseudomonas aeruginosa]|uniref:DUF7370 family protein n=1 Tax=Pseudomonas aeruginosa TaxID=287 RepID=UPI0020A673F6|nr:hypothetical protein [Pseudomonas aeruginosa]
MITVEQARQYLQSQGIDNVPDFILAAWIEQLQQIRTAWMPLPGIDRAADSGLPAGAIRLGQADKYISSQTAPSGASRSFRYQAFADRWKAQLALLNALDKYGCATGLIPRTQPRPHTAVFGSRAVAACVVTHEHDSELELHQHCDGSAIPALRPFDPGGRLRPRVRDRLHLGSER